MLARVQISLRAVDVVPAPGFISPRPDWALGFVEDLTYTHPHPLCYGWAPADLLPILQDGPRRCIAYLKLMPTSELERMPELLALEGWCECALGELEDAPDRFVAAANRFTRAAALSKGGNPSLHRAAAVRAAHRPA